jgi:hypothetical protein
LIHSSYLDEEIVFIHSSFNYVLKVKRTRFDTIHLKCLLKIGVVTSLGESDLPLITQI